jgi:hypothetical protein
MRPSPKHAPYSLYKKKTKSGLCWYVRFWNEETSEYSIVRSTGIPVEGKRERWREADDAAKTLLAELRQGLVRPETGLYGPAQPASSAAAMPEPSPVPMKSSPESPQPSGITTADMPIIQYLLDFWTPESEYAKYKSGVKKRPLSAYYIAMNHDDVKRHIASFPGFQNSTLGNISRKLLKEWLIWMSAKKVVHGR